MSRRLAPFAPWRAGICAGFFTGLLCVVLFPASSFAATVTGTISAGGFTPPSEVRVTLDGHVCGTRGPLFAESHRIDARGRAAGVVVYLEPLGSAGRAKRREKSVQVITQENCEYSPRVIGIPVGTRVRVKNADPLMHQLHASRPGGAVIANVLLATQGQEVLAFTARRPGRIDLRSEAGHSWMTGHVLVVPNAHVSATDDGGGYRIEGVPRGRHRLIAWHPVLGEVEKVIEVRTRSDVVRADLRFSRVEAGVMKQPDGRR